MKKLGVLFFLVICSTLIKAQSVSIANTNFDLSSSGDTAVIIVPLTMGTFPIANFALKSDIPEDVSIGTNHQERFRDAICLSPDYLENKLQESLMVTVYLSKLDQPGNYVVNFKYYDKSKQTPAYLPLTFTISRPAATLQCLNTVVVSKVDCDIDSCYLVLLETTGRAGISNLSLGTAFLYGPEKGSLVTFDRSSYRIKPGKMIKIPLNVHDDAFKGLSYGSTKGTIVISSPMLTSSVTVQFMIWKKIGRWLIIVTIILGLGMGIFVRHYLQQRQDLEQAKLGGYQLMQQIIEDSRPITDVAYLKQITGFLNNIQNAIDQKNVLVLTDASKIVAAVQQISSDYTTARNTFLSKMSTENDTYNSLMKAIVRNDLLPAIASSLTDAKQLLLKAKSELAAFNPTDTDTTLQDINTNLTNFQTSYTQYLTTFIAFLNGETFYPATDTGRVANSHSSEITNIQNALGKAANDAAQGWYIVLGDLNGAQELAEGISSILYKSVYDDYVNLDTKKDKANTPAFTHALQLWADGLKNIAVNDGDETVAADNWNPQLASHVDDIWNTGNVTTDQMIGNFQNAMLLRDISLPDDKSVSQTNSPDYYLGKNSLGEQRLLANIASSKKWYNLYNFIQLFFLTLLLSLAGYKAYGQQFVGTMDQLITIFLVAFAMDITVANVTVMRTASY